MWACCFNEIFDCFRSSVALSRRHQRLRVGPAILYMLCWGGVVEGLSQRWREGGNRLRKAERSDPNEPPSWIAAQDRSQTIYSQATINNTAAMFMNVLEEGTFSPKQLVYLIALKEKGIKLSAHNQDSVEQEYAQVPLSQNALDE